MNHINGWISSPFEQRPCRPRSDQKQHVSRPAIQSSLQAASVNISDKSIERKAKTCANEKLAAVGMRSCIGHREDTGPLESVNYNTVLKTRFIMMMLWRSFN